MSQALSEQTCVPCKGGVAPLSHVEATALLQDVPGWELKDNPTRIERRFTFGDFAEAFAFVGKVAAVAETENHHPDISFGWGYAVVATHTHAIEGLHNNDFILAAKANAALD